MAEGNPFFVEEILKSLMASGEIFYANGSFQRKPLGELHIPRSVQDAVQQRTNQLSEPARRVLILAAVAGRRFDFALLQALTRHDEDHLLQLFKGTVETHVSTILSKLGVPSRSRIAVWAVEVGLVNNGA